ncbi:MAG: class I SAM-dependent methyltransferase [Myxococcales bacterium]|nr:MAG: class I SAM-dependent methyltransferase [Myxococcales bacterium]
MWIGTNAACFKKSKRKLTGLDQDEALLARAKKRVPEAAFLQQNMIDFKTDQRFDAILSPFNTLYCLSSPQERLRFFSSVKNHLADDGIFVFDVWNASHAEENFDTHDTDAHFLTTIDVEDQSWHVYEQHLWSLPNHSLEARYRFVPASKDYVPLSQSIVHHYVSAEWLKENLQQQGFNVRFFGDFNQGSFDEDSEHCIAICQL